MTQPGVDGVEGPFPETPHGQEAGCVRVRTRRICVWEALHAEEPHPSGCLS